MVRKIREFEKPKVFLRQTQGTKKFKKLGNSNNCMFKKSGFSCNLNYKSHVYKVKAITLMYSNDSKM